MNITDIVRFGVDLVSSPSREIGFLKKPRYWIVTDTGPSYTGVGTRLAAPLTRQQPDGTRQLRVGHGPHASTLVLDALPVKWFRKYKTLLDDVSPQEVV